MIRKSFVIIAVITAILSGCGQNPASIEETVTTVESAAEIQDEATTMSEDLAPEEEETKPEGVGENTSAQDIQETSGASDAADVLPEKVLGEGRRLTDAELKEMEDFINGGGDYQYKNYGFLQSGYESPEYVDLYLVLYNGAGIRTDSLSEEERRAYIEAEGEIVTDIFRLTTEQIDIYLQEVAGIKMQSYKGDFTTYLPQFDAYYLQNGDTNLCYYQCVSGTEHNGEYRIYCQSDWSIVGGDGTLTVLKKKGDSYQFVSNQFLALNTDDKSLDELNGITSWYLFDQGLESSDGSDFRRSIFETDKRQYTVQEWLNMDPYLLAIARNEIYARHGYIFKNSLLNDFFGQYSWYEGKYTHDTFFGEQMNQYEKSNLARIQSLEIWN